MTRVLLLFIFLFSTSSFSSEAKVKCKNKKLKLSEREIACQKYLENELDDKEKVAALNRLGSVQVNLRKFTIAIESLTAALAIDSKYVRALRKRAYAYGRIKNYDKCIVDLSQAIDLKSSHSWSHFYKGFCYAGLDKKTEAYAAYTKAIEINPKSSVYYNRRGDLYRKDGKQEESVADFYRVLELKPFSPKIYVEIGKMLKNLNRNFEAYQAFSTVQLLSPGDYTVDILVDSVMTREAKIQLEDMIYTTPKKGIKIKYMQVVKPKSFAAEFGDILGNLFIWFQTDPKPIKKYSNTVEREILGTSNGTTKVKTTRLYQSKKTARSEVFQSILPKEISFPRGPKVRFVFDENELSKIYPLKTGKKSNGIADIVLLCPPFENPGTIEMGCSPGQWITVGEMKWNLSVGKPEQVLVPAGKFDTHIVNFYENSTLTMRGKTLSRVRSTTYWMSPKINWWVKRTQEQDGIGGKKGKISVSVATELTE